VRVFLGSQGLGALPAWLDELPDRPRRAALIPTAGNPNHDPLGQPIFLLEHAQRSGFLRAAPPAIRAGRVAYAGISAGAILTAPDLSVYDAPDDPGMVTSTAGLGLTTFYPLVHTNQGRRERYDRLMAASPALTFIPFNDDEAVVIKDGVVERRHSAITVDWRTAG
jgi:dipeptidase E